MTQYGKSDLVICKSNLLLEQGKGIVFAGTILRVQAAAASRDGRQETTYSLKTMSGKKIAGEIPAKSLMKFSDYTTRMRNDIRHTVNEIIKFSKLYLFLLPMAFIALAVVAYVVVHRLHFEQASIVAIMVSLLAPLVNRSYIDGLKEDMLDLLYEYNQLSSTNSSLKLKQYNLSMPDMRRPIKVARAGERALNSLRRNTELKHLLSGGKSKPKETVVKFETAKKSQTRKETVRKCQKRKTPISHSTPKRLSTASCRR